MCLIGQCLWKLEKRLQKRDLEFISSIRIIHSFFRSVFIHLLSFLQHNSCSRVHLALSGYSITFFERFIFFFTFNNFTTLSILRLFLRNSISLLLRSVRFSRHSAIYHTIFEKDSLYPFWRICSQH